MNEKEFVNFIKKSLNETSQLILISTKLKDIKKWDSLSSVRVLLELSKKMNKKLELNNIVNFKTLKELYNYFK
tara:strand:- start:926 stop:1144 length:219 start_codon:yes stop_codon:yes gene_type:complete